MKKVVKNKEKLIRCFNVVNDKNKKNFGLTCGHVLLGVNSFGKVAGIIICRHCKAKYEIIDNEVILIERKKQENKKCQQV